MSEIAEERLFGLVDIAERQQSVAQLALEGLAAERMAFAQERQQWANAVGPLVQDIRAAVVSVLSESLADAAESGTQAVKGAAEPLLDMMADVSTEARQAEAALRGVVQWASWRLLVWGLASLGGLALLWWLAVSAVLWWDTSAIGAAQQQKAQLEAEIAELKANHEGWVRAGLTGKLEQCGPKRRLCVRVDEGAGSFGDKNDYRVIQGY